jgi:flagellar motor protein MotB
METATNWNTTIDGMTAQRAHALETLAQLRAEKAKLALEAAMGGVEAQRKLAKINAKLNEIALDVDTWEQALAEAESKRREVEALRAREAGTARQAELSTLASTAMRHAAEFTDALRQAVKAGASLKLVVQNMLARASDTERPYLDRLLEAGPFMRAAEFVGLRSHLEFAPYPGPQAHILALEDALAVYLSRWLQPPEGSGN